jgi:GDPmannose 4,6-dehydratase
VAKIQGGYQDRIYLGNLNARRDWGFAPEYVEGMWQMVQQDAPGDYVLATGETHTVREFVEVAFAAAGYDIRWEDEGVDERGIDNETGETLVEIDPRYFRPSEVDTLIGDSSKATKEFGWEASTTFEELVSIMVKSDIETLEQRGEIALDYLG